MERALGVTVLGLITSEVPDDQCLVPAGRQEHVGAVSTVSASSRRRIDSSYFSIDVAKLVTQPFCDASSVVHGSRELRELEFRAGIARIGSEGSNLRGPPGCP